MTARPAGIRRILVAALASALLAGCAADESASLSAVPRPGAAAEKMGLERQVLAAKADLARRLGVQADAIEVLEAREVTWPDTSLGCPEPGMMYAQVLTPGVLVRLGYRGSAHRYHGGLASVPVPCPAGRAQAPVDSAPPVS